MVAHKGSTALTPVMEGRDRTNSTLTGQKRVSVKLTPDKSPVQSTKHPWKDRKALSEDYEGHISGREGWWRTYIRETPLPGSYETEDFLVDLDKRPHTYRFKSDGRKIDAHPHGKGALLLPGAYEMQPFTRRLEQQPATYNFKAIDRGQRGFNFGRKDKDINVSPNAYEMDKYLTVAVDKQPSKHSMFKSQSRRFPTMPFRPRIGPGPGNYEYSPEVPLHPVSSSFKSKTPRFSSSHTRVPGPGTYAKTHQYPMNNNISNMGRQHGLFFTSAFQA
ncbi:LOW QUALITY PROTEIN: protein STPG4-like [Pecten maximus]|uniref:LOW QUALITY PROTEIN: protein STPG4-like n=1 Tax=Pecten maximus TaxID=6579 RepID=UPI0014584AF0|nr:LOW QUALITY PROTEIN: protein STPG4-like [Pecten maximus]